MVMVAHRLLQAEAEAMDVEDGDVDMQADDRGVFEDLSAHVGLAFQSDKASEVVKLFTWTEELQEVIRDGGWSKEGEATRQASLLCYLFELGYDLLLHRMHRVSTKPGIEGPLNIGKAESDCASRARTRNLASASGTRSEAGFGMVGPVNEHKEHLIGRGGLLLLLGLALG